MGLCPDRPEGGQPDLTSGMQPGRLRLASFRRQDAALAATHGECCAHRRETSPPLREGRAFRSWGGHPV